MLNIRPFSNRVVSYSNHKLSRVWQFSRRSLKINHPFNQHTSNFEPLWDLKIVVQGQSIESQFKINNMSKTLHITTIYNYIWVLEKRTKIPRFSSYVKLNSTPPNVAHLTPEDHNSTNLYLHYLRILSLKLQLFRANGF